MKEVVKLFENLLRYKTTTRSRDELTVVDEESVVSLRQTFHKLVRVVHTAVQLAEVGQSRGPHPHDQVLVLVAIVGVVGWVELVDGLLPVHWLDRALERCKHQGLAQPLVKL